MSRFPPSRAAALLAGLSLLSAGAACQVGAPGADRVETTTDTAAGADTAAGEIPFRLAGPGEAALIVPVHVNGQGPFDFVFDTGATLTCMHTTVAEGLDLEDASMQGMGMGAGGSGRVRAVRIDSLRIGGTTAEGLMGCVLDLTQLQQLPGVEVQGLVGLNFMKSFRVTVDFGREVIRLEPL